MQEIFQQLYELETTPEALDATVHYLAERMKPFLQTLEPVLICFPDEGPKSLGGIFRRAVEMCEATPIFWGPDYRWKTLLHMAFETHANTIVGHPLVVLGLMKLSKATATPLYVYDAIVGGYPYARWMINGLRDGLDCKLWGFYALKAGPFFCGLTCSQEAGMHFRRDVFHPVVKDADGNEIFGRRGRLYFVSTKNPELVHDTNETAIVHYQPCACGCEDPRVVETNYVGEDNPTRALLEEKFLAWSSVLDYRAEYTEFGTALEMVVFPGESIPKLPSFAKLNVRPWNPEVDIPFCMEHFARKISEKTREDS